eukprot:UN23708
MNEETENILNKAKQTAKETQTEKSNIELTQQTEQQKLDVKEKSVKRLEEKATAVEAAEEKAVEQVDAKEAQQQKEAER